MVKNVVRLQKPLKLESGRESEQAARLMGGEFTASVSGNGQSFHSLASGIRALRKIIRQLDCNFHEKYPLGANNSLARMAALDADTCLLLRGDGRPGVRFHIAKLGFFPRLLGV